MKWIPFIDLTGLKALEAVIKGFHRRGVRVMLSGANDRVREKLKKARVLELVGDDNNFKDFAKALDAARELAQNP